MRTHPSIGAERVRGPFFTFEARGMLDLTQKFLARNLIRNRWTVFVSSLSKLPHKSSLKKETCFRPFQTGKLTQGARIGVYLSPIENTSVQICVRLILGNKFSIGVE
jgi:hypothetical protein